MCQVSDIMQMMLIDICIEKYPPSVCTEVKHISVEILGSLEFGNIFERSEMCLIVRNCKL